MGDHEGFKAAESEAAALVSAAPPPTENSPANKETDAAEQAYSPDDVSPGKNYIIVPEDKITPLVLQKEADPSHERSSGEPNCRDDALARVEREKRLALIQAWEESEKTKADNKAYKKLSAVEAWENTKRATIEAELKQIEEKYERKKAEYAEKMKNKVAGIHQLAEEKRASVEAQRKEEFLKTEEMGEKFRASGQTPRKFFSFFKHLI